MGKWLLCIWFSLWTTATNSQRNQKQQFIGCAFKVSPILLYNTQTLPCWNNESFPWSSHLQTLPQYRTRFITTWIVFRPFLLQITFKYYKIIFPVTLWWHAISLLPMLRGTFFQINDYVLHYTPELQRGGHGTKHIDTRVVQSEGRVRQQKHLG